MIPVGVQVEAVQVGGRTRGLRFRPIVTVALDGDGVGGAGRPVELESALRLGPVVVRVDAALRHRVGAPDVADVGAPGEVVADPSAVADRGAAIEASAAHGHERALGLVGLAGDDVDDAVDRVGAPECRARAADHLDAVDVFRDDVLGVPVDAGEQRIVDRPPVDQHQQLVRERLVGEVARETARRDYPAVRAGLGDEQIGRQPQNVGQARGAGAGDLVVGDDVERRWRVAERLAGLGRRRHRQIRQLADRESLDVLDGLGPCGRSREGGRGGETRASPPRSKARRRAPPPLSSHTPSQVLKGANATADGWFRSRAAKKHERNPRAQASFWLRAQDRV